MKQSIRNLILFYMLLLLCLFSVVAVLLKNLLSNSSEQRSSLSSFASDASQEHETPNSTAQCQQERLISQDGSPDGLIDQTLDLLSRLSSFDVHRNIQGRCTTITAEQILQPIKIDQDDPANKQAAVIRDAMYSLLIYPEHSPPDTINIQERANLISTRLNTLNSIWKPLKASNPPLLTLLESPHNIQISVNMQKELDLVSNLQPILISFLTQLYHDIKTLKPTLLNDLQYSRVHKEEFNSIANIQGILLKLEEYIRSAQYIVKGFEGYEGIIDCIENLKKIEALFENATAVYDRMPEKLPERRKPGPLHSSYVCNHLYSMRQNISSISPHLRPDLDSLCLLDRDKPIILTSKFLPYGHLSEICCTRKNNNNRENIYSILKSDKAIEFLFNSEIICSLLKALEEMEFNTCIPEVVVQEASLSDNNDVMIANQLKTNLQSLHKDHLKLSTQLENALISFSKHPSDIVSTDI